MKTTGFFFSLLLPLIVALPAGSQGSQVDPLPNSGTYFIVNVSSEEALQPAGNTVGQNVLLYPYNKSGMQKWVATRRIDLKTKKPTNRYTFRLAGETANLNLQPHPVADMTAILGDQQAVYTLESNSNGLLIKSVDRNGDALYIVPSPPMYAEAKFGPDDGSTKFRWNFIPAD